MSATVVGALLGVGVQLYANVAQKLPALSSPWRHAASAVIGAGVASLVLDVEERATKDVQGGFFHGNLLGYYNNTNDGLLLFDAERMAARVAADTKQRA